MYVVDSLMHAIDQLQGLIFEDVVQPVLYQLGLMQWSDDLFDGVGSALFGALAILLAYLILRPLEWWRPVERWNDRRAVRTDIVYTLVNRLGIIPAVLFLVLTPMGAAIDGYLRFKGYIPPSLEQMFPPLLAFPLLTFLVYVVVIDFGEYWRHRLQHRLSWWWALHSLHHDQRQMTLWSDDRNHFLDNILAAMWTGAIAMLIGVTPSEFPLVLIAFRLIESLSHSNVRLGFGVLTPLMVGPQYHRLHHAVEHAQAPFDRARGCNFAVILPVWDVLFGTCRRAHEFPSTGVAGIAGPEVRASYLHHQVIGLKRLGAEIGRMVGWRRTGFSAAIVRD